jgi:hypothetical protein
MARYLVQAEGPVGQPGAKDEPFEGLAVARAFAQKKAERGEHAFVVRHAATGEVVARFGPPPGASTSTGIGTTEARGLARSVRRMRAANDRLKQVLTDPPTGSTRTKR